MKAEHRKELETNVLADRMGRFVEGMKQRPQRRIVWLAVITFLVLLVVFVAYRLYIGSQQQAMTSWLMLESGSPQEIVQLANLVEETQPDGSKKLKPAETTDPSKSSKAARFQLARFFLWDRGIQVMGFNSRDALKNVRSAETLYNSLLKDCEGELEFEAEARYGLAVIDETLALQNQDRLATAEKQFEEIAEKYKNSSFAPLAEKRARQLRDNRTDIARIYRDLQTKFNIAEEKTEKLLPILP